VGTVRVIGAARQRGLYGAGGPPCVPDTSGPSGDRDAFASYPRACLAEPRSGAAMILHRPYRRGHDNSEREQLLGAILHEQAKEERDQRQEQHAVFQPQQRGVG